MFWTYWKVHKASSHSLQLILFRIKIRDILQLGQEFEDYDDIFKVEEGKIIQYHSLNRKEM